MSSRSAFMPASIREANSNDPPPPGPPDRTTRGSGLGFADTAGTRITKMRIVRPPVLLRSSGTVRYPHRMFAGKSYWGRPGMFGFGQVT
jgi:hypothetical protein